MLQLLCSGRNLGWRLFQNLCAGIIGVGAAEYIEYLLSSKQACCIASTCKFLLYFFTFFFWALQLFYSVRSRILSYVIGPRFIKMRVGSHSRTRVPLCTIFRLFRGACAKTGASGKSALCVSQYHNMPLACQIPPTETTCRCFCPLPTNVDICESISFSRRL